MSENEWLTAIRAIWPDMIERFDAARESGTDFVHYTNAAATMSMIEGPSVWLRNASCMNDYGEIEYGIDNIIGFFGTEKGKEFWQSLDENHSDLSTEIKKSFDDWRFDLSGQTYILCLSEHDKTEDKYGRLSMWRAYGRDNGIAIVINSEPLLRESDAIGAFTFPVFYFDEEEIHNLFEKVASNAIAAKPFMAGIDRKVIHAFVFWLLQTFSLSLKHPAFMEEREWRIVYRPNQNKSNVLREKNVVIHGLPQIIYELPLENITEKEFYGISPDELIKKILIGPTEFPLVLKQSIGKALSEAGVNEPSERINVTNIPLRQS